MLGKIMIHVHSSAILKQISGKKEKTKKEKKQKANQKQIGEDDIH